MISGSDEQAKPADQTEQVKQAVLTEEADPAKLLRRRG
jgi:hypothetical protein